MTDQNRIEVIKEELSQFEKSKVWTLVPLPKGQSAIGTKWVFKTSLIKMEKLLEIKQDWWHMVTISKKALTMMKLLPP